MIEIKNLSFGYKKNKTLFSELRLKADTGNIYGLLGKNGAGKTTLLKLITGLLFPQKGECLVMGYKPMQRLPMMLEEIYFIPEVFYVPPLKIKDYMSFYSGFYPRFNENNFFRYLNEFEIDKMNILSALSYGQQKKFLLAFALATDCNLLILDEPTNGLDIPAKSQFRKLLASCLTEQRTFIISTHQVRDLANIIDPIIILDQGQIIFNHYTNDVSNLLTISVQNQEPDDDSALYYEKVLGGYAVIEENKSNKESEVDIELLFNAVINQRQKIDTIFKKGATE